MEPGSSGVPGSPGKRSSKRGSIKRLFKRHKKDSDDGQHSCRQSLSQRFRIHGHKNTIEQRRIPSDLHGTGAASDRDGGGSGADNLHMDSHTSLIHGPVTGRTVFHSPLELPEVVSLHSSKSYNNASSASQPQDPGAGPRRSLQNSNSGLMRISTIQKAFNIPVTLELHERKSENPLEAGTNPNMPISGNNTGFLNPGKSSAMMQTNSSQELQPPISVAKTLTRSSSAHSFFGSILAFTHNHMPRIKTEPENDLKIEHSSTPKSTATKDAESETCETKRPQISIQPTADTSVRVRPLEDDTSFTLQTSDGERNVVQPGFTNANRNHSFLRRLDTILSPIDTSNSGDYNANNLPLVKQSTSAISATPGNVDAENPLTKSSGGVDSSKSKTADTNFTDSANASNPRVTFKKGAENDTDLVPPILTFGKGNLTLEALVGDAETEELDLKDRIPPINRSNSSSARLLLPYATNNHSATALSSIGNDANNLYHRERSKTLPIKDTSSISDGNNNVISNNNSTKRFSRLSNVSNDDESTFDSSNDRKPRSASKKFLSRRSFSPTNIGMKVIPNLRSSMSRARNSTEASNDNRPRFSTNFLGEINSSGDAEGDIEIPLTGIEYTTEKKNAEFHNLFKDSGVRPGERLIIDHSCALSRDILLQGRMYISDQHICFYSNILGWVSTVFIPFKEIVQIEKKATAGIFPNGIVINTLHTKYVFASFISRDSTFDLITNVWNQIILGRAYSKETGSSDMVSDLSNNEDIRLTNSSDYYEDDETSDMDETDLTSSDEFEKHNMTDTSLLKSKRLSPLLSVAPMSHSPTVTNYKPSTTEKLISESNFSSPLASVVDILFGDDTSYLRSILEAQNVTDISAIPMLLENKTRTFTYTKPLPGNIGPSKTKCIVSETLDHLDLSDYVKVTQSSKTPDVPSGNLFIVKTIYIMSWDKANTTKVSVYFSMEWSGKSWLKNVIEKGSIDGVTESVKSTFQEIENILANETQYKNNSKSSSYIREENEDFSALPKYGPEKHEPTEADLIKGKEYTVTGENINFPAPLGTVFKILYGADTSYLLKILENQNNFNISDIPEFVNDTREFTYIKRLNNSIGPKQTKCIQTEYIEHMDLDSYIMVRQVVKSPDVPSGNNFAVNTRLYFSWGTDNSTNMTVITNIVWSGKSFLKSAIEKGSIEGQKSSTKSLTEELNQIISSGASSSSVSRKKSKRKTKSNKQHRKVKEVEKTTVESKNEIDNSVENDSLTQRFIALAIDLVTDNLSMPSFKSISIIVLFVTILLFMRSQLTATRDNIKIIKHGMILIDGYEYNYVPNFKTLYQVYEESIRGGGYPVNSNDHNTVLDSEVFIWDWIDERKDKLSSYNESVTYDEEQVIVDRLSEHNLQRIRDSITLTEIKLEKMRSALKKASDQQS